VFTLSYVCFDFPLSVVNLITCDCSRMTAMMMAVDASSLSQPSLLARNAVPMFVWVPTSAFLYEHTVKVRQNEMSRSCG